MRKSEVGVMLISVIIPCFNVDTYIEECVLSVIAQTYGEKEIICIDNNSSDDTWQKLLQLKDKYPELIIIKELKPGAPAARNKGLLLSTGEWIQFLDADDLLLPEKIERQVELIEQNNDVCFVVGSCIKRSIDHVDQKIIVSYGNPFVKLLNTELGNTCANLFKKSEIQKIGGWDESFSSSQEAHLMFELLKVNDHVIFDQQANTIVREREQGQISQSNPARKWSVYTQLRVEILRYLETNLPDFYQKQKNKILDNFFDILRIFAKYDRKQAITYFYEFFPKKFTPSPSPATTSKYVSFYKFLGFAKTEWLISKLNKTARK